MSYHFLFSIFSVPNSFHFFFIPSPLVFTSLECHPCILPSLQYTWSLEPLTLKKIRLFFHRCRRLLQHLSIHRLKLYESNFGEVNISIAQSTIPISFWPPCSKLSESIPKQSYNYSLGMMTAFFYADVKLFGTTVHLMFIKDDDREVLNDGYHLTMFGWCHHHAAFDVLQKEGNHTWTNGPLCWSCIEMGQTFNILSPWRLSEWRTDTVSALIEKEWSFVDIIKTLVTYAGPVEPVSLKEVVDDLVEAIVNDILS